jgi:aldose 1-epimerase
VADVTTLHERNGGPTAVPLTGHQYHIGAGPYRATVTELGAGLRELLHDDQPLIAGYQPDELPPGGAGQLLATWLDHALTDLERDGDGRAWVHLVASSGTESGVRLWADEGYRWLQVFTGDPLGPDLRRRALAVEPMTCPPNAFVTGDDLLILSPGEAVTHTWGIDVF